MALEGDADRGTGMEAEEEDKEEDDGSSCCLTGLSISWMAC